MPFTTLCSKAQGRMRRYLLSAVACVVALTFSPVCAPAKDKDKKYDRPSDRYGYGYNYGGPGRGTGQRDNAEIRYMKRMMDLNQAGVRLGSLAQDRARHGELRDFAASMQARLRRQNDNFLDQLDSWYRVRYAPRPDEDFLAKMDVASRTRGDEFEIRILKTMVDYFNQRMTETHRGLDKSITHSDLQSLTQRSLDRDRDSRDQARAWLRKWYNIDYRG